MKLCPECKSDNIEYTSSTGMRVLVCLIFLLLVPFGFLFCWVPFVFSHTFNCNTCGYGGKEELLRNIDWRDKEELLNNYKHFEKKLGHLFGNWFIDEENIYKVVKGAGQYILLKVTPVKNPDDETINKSKYTKDITPYRILDLQDTSTDNPEVHNIHLLVEDISSKFSVFEPAFRELSFFGKKLITKEEYSYLEYLNYEGLLDMLRQEHRVIDPINYEISY